MTRQLRLLSTAAAATVAAVSAVVPSSVAGASVAAAPVPSAVTVVFTKAATAQLTAGDNRVEGRGQATVSASQGRISANLPYRNQDEQGPVEGLAGQLAFTGAGPDVVWRRLQVDFLNDAVTGFTGRGERLRLLRTITLDSDRRGASEDTALTLTPAGARSLNLAAAGSPFAAGDLVATADGLA